VTAAIFGLSAVGAVIFLAVIADLCREHREKRAAEPSRTVPADAHGPAVRTTWPGGRVPGAERDGEPLSEQEAAAFIGCLFASNTAIAEVTYEGNA
jgi:hypothetical protein